MKHFNFLSKLSIVLILIVCTSQKLRAQAITPQDLIDSWDIMTKMVVQSAKIMPAEHFSFTPGDPVRSFANQLNHTTASNIGFGKSVNAGKPDFAMPDRANPPQSKDEVVDVLEKSFSYFRGGLEKLSQNDLAQKVQWGHPSNPKQITRLKAVLIVMSHLQREHGKSMMYLRAKGLKPAPAGSWKF